MFELKRSQRIYLVINGQVITDYGNVVLVETDKGFQVSEGYSERTIKDTGEAYNNNQIIKAHWDMLPAYKEYADAENVFNMKVEELRTSITPQVGDNLRVETVFPEGYVTVVPKKST